MRRIAFAIAILAASAANAEDFSSRDIELKNGADYCYANPLTTYKSGAQRNNDMWPEPCQHITREYETSGAKERYEQFYLKERQEMIDQLKRIK